MTEEIKSCQTCQHFKAPAPPDPCFTCVSQDSKLTNWEPALPTEPARYRLTAKMANAMQEIIDDEKAADQTLRTAMAFHASTHNEIQKRSREVWDSIGREFGIPVRSQNFKVVNEDGVAYVVAAPLEKENACKD